MAWYPIVTDNFTRANQAGLGNGWTAPTASWSIASNQAVQSATANPWINSPAIRPASENSLNSRVVFSIPAQTISGTPYPAIYASHRLQVGTSAYFLGIDITNGVQFFTFTTGATVSLIGTATVVTGGYIPTHNYTFDCSVSGTNPTTLTATLTDVTTSTVVATKTATDSTAALQSIGQTAMFISIPTAGATYALSGFASYTDIASAAATAYTLTGASSTVTNLPTSYAVTLNGTVASTVVVTPSDSSAGGTFTPTTLSFLSAGPNSQSFTYTASSAGTKSLSSTNSSTLTNPSALSVAVAATTGVTSPAFMFSPGNWKGDTGRGGSLYRRSWNNGSYLTFSFTASASPTAVILIPSSASTNILGIYVNGAYTDEIPGNTNYTVTGLIASSLNVIRVVLKRSTQALRWNSGVNGVQINGIAIDAASVAGTAPVNTQWALIIGDSITEGILANNGVDSSVQGYSFALGRFLETQGMDYCISACGGSGWLRPGDSSGDVPAYYVVSGSTGGVGGTYTDASSRWNKIDQGVSLLSTDNLMSSYGAVGTPPSVIYINYMTNDVSNGVNLSDVQASITQSLVALRAAAPNAAIIIQIPFAMYGSATATYNQSYVTAIKTGVPAANVGATILDLGPLLSRTITTAYYVNGDFVHPNVFGHQYVSSVVNGNVSLAITPSLAQIASAVWSRSQRTVTA